MSEDYHFCKDCGGMGENFELKDDGSSNGLKTCPKCGGSGRDRKLTLEETNTFNNALEVAIKAMELHPSPDPKPMQTIIDVEID